MKVAILSESEADEAGIRILCEAILQSPIELLEPVRVRHRGWTGAFKNLPATFMALHWYHPDADGLIAVLDSDDTPTHNQTHEEAGWNDPDCHSCELHRVILNLRNSLPARQPRPLKVAIGVAMPAIEAWYQCGIDPHSTEARFARERQDHPNLYHLRRELKTKSYGVFPASEDLARRKAIEHCRRLTESLDGLERLFPAGFGMLARDLRRW